MTLATSSTPAVREAFERIMAVFEAVACGRPKEEHQEAIKAILERLDEDSYSEGQGER